MVSKWCDVDFVHPQYHYWVWAVFANGASHSPRPRNGRSAVFFVVVCFKKMSCFLLFFSFLVGLGSKEKEVEGDSFTFNSNFTHKLYRITVSQITPKELLDFLIRRRLYGRGGRLNWGYISHSPDVVIQEARQSHLAHSCMAFGVAGFPRHFAKPPIRGKLSIGGTSLKTCSAGTLPGLVCLFMLVHRRRGNHPKLSLMACFKGIPVRCIPKVLCRTFWFSFFCRLPFESANSRNSRGSQSGPDLRFFAGQLSGPPALGSLSPSSVLL